MINLPSSALTADAEMERFEREIQSKSCGSGSQRIIGQLLKPKKPSSNVGSSGTGNVNSEASAKSHVDSNRNLTSSENLFENPEETDVEIIHDNTNEVVAKKL